MFGCYVCHMCKFDPKGLFMAFTPMLEFRCNDFIFKSFCAVVACNWLLVTIQLGGAYLLYDSVAGTSWEMYDVCTSLLHYV